MSSLDHLIDRRRTHVEYLDKLKAWNQGLLQPQDEHSNESQSSTMSAASHNSSPNRAAAPVYAAAGKQICEKIGSSQVLFEAIW
jgi:hypothetical protein